MKKNKSQKKHKYENTANFAIDEFAIDELKKFLEGMANMYSMYSQEQQQLKTKNDDHILDERGNKK